MSSFKQRCQKLISILTGIAGLNLMIAAIWWPPHLERILHSQIGTGVLAACCAAFSAFSYGPFCAALAKGIHEFRKAAKEVTDEFNDWQ